MKGKEMKVERESLEREKECQQLSNICTKFPAVFSLSRPPAPKKPCRPSGWSCRKYVEQKQKGERDGRTAGKLLFAMVNTKAKHSMG